MEISNKMLAWLVVAAIMVSVLGTVISLNRLNQTSSLTGFATSNATGTAAVAISSQTVLRFVVASVDFGSGSINTSAGYYNCTMAVNDSTTGTIVKSNGCGGFNTVTGSTFQLQNAGTTYLNVTLNFSADASTFIGGVFVPPSFKFAVSPNVSGDAVCLNYPSSGTWTEVTVAGPVNICGNMSYQVNNTLKIGINITIPADAQGSKNVTVTAQGTG